MNIRGKMLSVIAFALFATALANVVVLKILVFPTFIELEQEAAARNIQRVIEAINSEIEDVDKTLWDYSSWDDSYEYAKGNNKYYTDENFSVETLQNMRLDIVEIYNKINENILSVIFNRTANNIQHVDWMLGDFAETQRLLSLPNDSSKITGVILTPHGPALVASRPIVKTNGEGPSVGTFLFGRFLNDSLITILKDKIKVDFALTLLATLTEAENTAYQRLLKTRQSHFVEEADKDQLIAYVLIRDIDGKPVLLASAKIKRDISQIGQRVLVASVGGFALTAIGVMAVLAVLLQWALVGPLVRLTQQVVEIGTDGSLNRRVALSRRDEIGILSREFDRMLASLAEARNRLLDHSYQSGIAHMASGVLHNLRNQLMPAMTRVERLQERITGHASHQLDAALSEFASEQITPDRKAKIATYLALSAQDMRERQEGITADLRAISHDLVRVESVLGDLDRFSRISSKIDAISLAACVQETIATVPSFPDVAVAIRIAPELDSQTPVISESFILRHVLQNLFVNAIEAITATGKTSGTIDVTAQTRSVDGEAFIDLAIHDDGIGIAPEHLSEIFKRGFSTKRRAAGGWPALVRQ
ncbi:MAG: HAMP domain-containing protein [Defluviicoccus sp.]|nr:MAG: HAMP domain-containing protein [Defluviicoccus sp.]